jgi:hypothetical protein
MTSTSGAHCRFTSQVTTGLGKLLAQRRQGRHRMDDVAQRTRFDQQESAYGIGHSATRDDQRCRSAAGLCVAWATIQSTACDNPSAT